MQDLDSGIWAALKSEAEEASAREIALSPFLRDAILRFDRLGDALGHLLALRLGRTEHEKTFVLAACNEAFAANHALVAAVARDMQASHDLDPACRSWLQPFLHFKGVTAMMAHRAAAWLWQQGRHSAAYHLQGACSQVLQVDIHPAAVIGNGIFIDHATGVVIGETSVVGDDVTIMQSVTLGGNGKERGDRHPKIGRGVLIGAGAKVLGNIRVGDEARIAACSVVLKDVEPRTTVAGIPAIPVSTASPMHPAQELEQKF